MLFLSCSYAVQPIQLMGKQLDLRIVENRWSFLLFLVQAYRLLAVMCAAVPQLLGRWSPFSEIVTEDSMHVSTLPML